jgi:hypothetical protein
MPAVVLKVKPMPNWCLNKLTVRGSELAVDAFRKLAVGHSPWPRQREAEDKENPLNFHNLVPIPSEVLATGYVDGANWERENWGCTYGASETLIVEEWHGLVIYVFQTPWLPPIKLLETIARHFPELTFMLDYDEPDVGFKGIARFKGEAKEDHCLNY